jgi:hypothetical protein
MILQQRPEIALVLNQRTTGFGRLLSGSFCPIRTFAAHLVNGNIWSVLAILAARPAASVDALDAEHYPKPPCSTSTAPRNC